MTLAPPVRDRIVWLAPRWPPPLGGPDWGRRPILSVLAHSLITNFQITLAVPQRTASAKRRSLFLVRSIHTLRYELLGRAGLVRHPEGRATLTLAPNLPTQALFERTVAKLAQAASVVTIQG